MWFLKIWKYAFSHDDSTSIGLRIIRSQMDYWIAWQAHGKCISVCPNVVMLERDTRITDLLQSSVYWHVTTIFSFFLNKTLHVFLGAISVFFWFLSKTTDGPSTHIVKTERKKKTETKTKTHNKPSEAPMTEILGLVKKQKQKQF